MIRYIFAVFAGGCSYGMLSTFIKTAYSRGFSQSAVISSQYLIGIICMWLAFLFTDKVRISKRQALQLLLCGIPTSLTSIFYYKCLETVPASLAVVLLFQFIWIDTLFETILYRKLPSKRKLAAVAILIAGSLLAAGVINSGETIQLGAGIIWGLLSAVSYAAMILFSGTVGVGIPPVEKSTIMTTGGFILIMICYPPEFLAAPMHYLPMLPLTVILGILGIALPPFLYAVGMPHTGPALGSILSSSELPVSMLMAFFILHESVAPLQWAGMALILIGIILPNTQAVKEALRRKG
ncbi:MAG: EamA family transporter [Eubacterium sp.]